MEVLSKTVEEPTAVKLAPDELSKEGVAAVNCTAVEVPVLGNIAIEGETLEEVNAAIVNVLELNTDVPERLEVINEVPNSIEEVDMTTGSDVGRFELVPLLEEADIDNKGMMDKLAEGESTPEDKDEVIITDGPKFVLADDVEAIVTDVLEVLTK